MRKVLSLLMILVVTLVSTTGVFANEKDKSHDYSGVLEIQKEQMDEARVITFDEMVKSIAKYNEISEKEAINRVVNNSTKSKSSKSFKALSETDKLMELRGSKYIEYTQTLDVDKYYKPKLVFYCEYSSYGSYGGIKRILDTTMDRKGKQFSGKIYVNLESAEKIFWKVSGDFYHNGTTTVTGGGEVGIGENAKVHFSVSGSSNHYKYFYDSGRKKVGGSIK
ncbi:hypothetical protein [Wukongibacter sp. M2B1]|uniref:hypothetical protein n=1 Tax=Wukongibacter sp. M2B1 TaxID=3088895 RepID=UPI003D7B86FB